MLRRFRKHPGYNDVEALFDEDEDDDTMVELQHSYEEADCNQSPHRPQHDPAPPPQSALLDAIHVQVRVASPSSVERQRNHNGGLQRQRPDSNSRSHRHRHSTKNSTRTIDTPTTRSSNTRSATPSLTRSYGTPTTRSAASNTTAVMNKKTICGRPLCQVDCMHPFLMRPLLHLHSEDESMLMEYSTNHDLMSNQTDSMEENSLVNHVSIRERKQREEMLPHAYAYNPTPPRRRTKLTYGNVISGGSKKSPTISHDNAVNSEHVAKEDTESNAETVAHEHEPEEERPPVLFQPTNETILAVRRHTSPAKAERPISSTHNPAAANQAVANKPTVSKRSITPTIRSLQAKKKLNPSDILRAISPVRQSNVPRIDSKSGGKGDIEKQFPTLSRCTATSIDERNSASIVKTKDLNNATSTSAKVDVEEETKPNLTRRTFAAKQRRSPSPVRRPSPPSSSSASEQPIARIRNALRKSPEPSPSREVQPVDPVTQQSTSISKLQSEQPIARIRNALRRSPSPLRTTKKHNTPVDPAGELLGRNASRPRSRMRRAFTAKRSPSRDATPMESRPSSAIVVSLAAQPVAKIRKALRRSPSPLRAEQPVGTTQTGGAVARIRRALTPKRSISPSRTVSPGLMNNRNGVKRFFKKKVDSDNGDNVNSKQSPPDPPASPSWKVGGGSYSPRRGKKIKSTSQSKPKQQSQQTEVLKSDNKKHSSMQIMQEQQQSESTTPNSQQHESQNNILLVRRQDLIPVEETSSSPKQQLHQSLQESQQSQKPQQCRKQLNESELPQQQKPPKQQDDQKRSAKQPTRQQRRQRHNYQQYIMIQKQRAKQRQISLLDKEEENERILPPTLAESQHKIKSEEVRKEEVGSFVSPEEKQPNDQISEWPNIRYQMFDPPTESKHPAKLKQSLKSVAQMEQTQSTTSKQHNKKIQQIHQPLPNKSERESGNQDIPNSLSAPFQMKKVLSSPSIMVSTLTSQTANTTSTSKFWDGVEEYQTSLLSPITPPQRITSYETGLHGNPKKFDNITEEEVVIINKLNEKTKELQEFFQGHLLSEDAQQRQQLHGSPLKPRIVAPITATPASPTGSGIDTAFSLNLPMNKHGFFDDSDISALAMGDSATVYHIRASAEAKKNTAAGDYWKEKYEKLKEETRRANLLVLEEVEKEDTKAEKKLEHGDVASNIERSASPLEGVSGALKKMKQKRIERKNSAIPAEHDPSMLDDPSQFVQQQQPLLSCGGYMGGKKAKDLARINLACGKDRQTSRSIFDRAHCFLPEEAAPRQPDQRHITHIVPSEDEDIGDTNTKQLRCSVQVVAEDDLVVYDSRADTSLGLESLNSDFEPLREIGYVQRFLTPSPQLIEENSENDDEGLACYNDPMYVMDDADALKEWNKIRQPKALADELSATASRGIASKESSTDGSELSENAKLIFEAAIKHDIKTLRLQRSRSASRTPVSQRSMRRASPIRSPMTPEKSTISSLEASGTSNHFAANIPADFASWYELPSPSCTSCITLIPMLKGHLRNAAVVELLSGLDGGSKKIDANGVHRITPKHRVSDVIEKSFREYTNSPSVAVNKSLDSEYMGPIIADGDGGSIRFANAAIHLGGISDAATSHIKKREFQYAIEIYSTLLQSCQSMSGWLVEQLIASTLHNLCVLHLWKEEFDLALPFARECIRIKNDNEDDNNLLMIHSWANLGLIHYALEAHKSAIVAFRNAVELSEDVLVNGNSSLVGRLQNNLGCVNVEIGNVDDALFEFEESLRRQKDTASLNDDDTSDAENLLCISMTIFNIGVACAKQKKYQTAMKHVTASHAMQEALLGTKSEIVGNTMFYLNLVKKVVASSHIPDLNTPKKVLNHECVESSHAITRKDEVLDFLDINPDSPARQMKLESKIKHNEYTSAKTDGILYPLLSLGSLKVEATAVEKVRACLDCYDINLRQCDSRRNDTPIGRNLLCRQPPFNSKQKGIPGKLMNFGKKTLRKLEVQAELNDNLERYGPRHPLVGQCHHSLGLVLLCVESFKESINHFDESIRINTHALGARHPDISSSLMFMALAQFALENFEDAMASIIRVQRLRENELGKVNHEMYQIVNNLACVQFERGNLKEAESLFQEALNLQREIFCTEPQFLKGVSTVLFNVAFVHAKNGVFAKALIELEGALQIRQDILFEDASTGDITENMAYILAIHQLQHGSGNIDDITNEYIAMLRRN